MKINIVTYARASVKKIRVLLKLHKEFLRQAKNKNYDCALNIAKRIERVKHTI
jgi:hypothetical protein